MPCQGTYRYTHTEILMLKIVYTHTCTLFQVYGNFDEFKVCSCLEVYGVLSRDPALADVGGGEGEASGGDITMETASERRAHCPPPSLTPRIHAITVQHLTHNNPLLPWKLSIPSDRKGALFSLLKSLEINILHATMCTSDLYYFHALGV